MRLPFRLMPILPIVQFPLRRALVLLCLFSLLGGCSMLYNYRVVDWRLRWYVDDYIPWTDSQEKDFKARLRAQLQWHQSTQLPRYRALLESARVDLIKPWSVALLDPYTEQLQGFGTDVFAHLESDITALLAGLSDRQVEALLRQCQSEQADRIDEYGDLTLAKLHERRARSMRKSIEAATGTLTASQRALITAWAEALPDSRPLWLSSQQRWIDSLHEALARRSQGDVFASDVHALFVAPREHWTPEYRQLLDSNTELTLQLLVDVHNSLSEHQRLAMDASLQQWVKTIDTLARNAY